VVEVDVLAMEAEEGTNLDMVMSYGGVELSLEDERRGLPACGID